MAATGAVFVVGNLHTPGTQAGSALVALCLERPDAVHQHRVVRLERVVGGDEITHERAQLIGAGAELEVDRRVIRKRIQRLKDEIEGVRKTRQIQRKRRVEETLGISAGK